MVDYSRLEMNRLEWMWDKKKFISAPCKVITLLGQSCSFVREDHDWVMQVLYLK